MTSEARFILSWVVAEAINALLVGSCVFAIIKGRPAERLGGLLYLVSFLFDTAVVLLAWKFTQQLPMLMFDAAVAVGFLVLAIRYNNLWLGAVMMLKGAQLALHATHLTDEADVSVGGWNLYFMGLNTISVMISSTLILATRASLRARRARRAAAKPDGTAPAA